MGYLGEFLGSGSTTTKGLYPLNGDSTDKSGNGNNGTATNVTRVDGKIGSGAGSFNGSSSKISGSGINLGTGNVSVTISGRFNFTNKNVIYRTLLNVGTESVNQAFVIFNRGSGEKLVDFGTWGAVNCSFSYDKIIQNKWHNIIGTHDGTTTKVYLDGEFQSSITKTPNIQGTNFSLGARQNSSEFFPGLIDEVIIENRAWTAQEVRKYYTYAQGKFGIL